MNGRTECTVWCYENTRFNLRMTGEGYHWIEILHDPLSSSASAILGFMPEQNALETLAKLRDAISAHLKQYEAPKMPVDVVLG